MNNDARARITPQLVLGVAVIAFGLILTLDIVLSPYWVWIFFDERVDLRTFIGGAIVALAVAGHLILSMRDSRRPVRAPAH